MMLGGTLGLMRVASTVGDPYWANVSLLLHMDGANGGKIFTDQKGHVFTVKGNAVTSTTSPKFGSSCAAFSGTGDSIDTPSSADFNLGTGNWTVEFFLKTTANGQYLFGQSASDASAASISIYGYIAAGKVRIGYYTAGATTVDSVASVNDGIWHHVAGVRNNNVLTVYVDGVGTSRASEPSPINSSSSIFAVGALGAYPPNPLSGSIDEFRLTRGVARYTANFTPPAAAFLNS